MEFKPHNYQKYAIDYIINNPLAMLFLDMGLGKTVITLTAINTLIYDRFEVNKVLVIAPIRVAKNTWPDEIKKWPHLSYLTYAVAVGDVKQRKKALEENADITIINRENVSWLINESGYEFDYDMLVIDEISSFKNPSSLRFKALRKVRPFIDRVVGLTGTPTSNGLLDLWSQFYLIDKGQRLGKFVTHYRNRFFDYNPYTHTYTPLKHAKRDIFKRIDDITVSMKAIDLLEMPEQVIIEKVVDMDSNSRKLYGQLKDDQILQLGDAIIDSVNAAVLSNKLIQMANGNVYDEDKNTIHLHEAKLDGLEDIIEQANGQSLLVAYWFKSDLDAIKSRFPQAREIKTSEDIKDWNEGKISLALMHPASAGHGLNLQKGGHILVWYSLIWSLELYQQTNGRLYRQGQSNNSVTIVHILCRDTIDAQVYDSLHNKNRTQADLINAVKVNLRK